jgi:CBS domain containing-hemolysin-like protein
MTTFTLILMCLTAIGVALTAAASGYKRMRLSESRKREERSLSRAIQAYLPRAN